MKKQTEGKRFTKIERQELSLEDLAGVPFPSTLKKIDEARQVAETILEDRGFPANAKISWTGADGREWHGFLDGYIAEIYPKDSQEWYAARIVVACHRLQKATGNQAVELAFQVGQLTAYARAHQILDQGNAKGGRKSSKYKQWADALAKELCHLSDDEIEGYDENFQIRTKAGRYDIEFTVDPEKLTPIIEALAADDPTKPVETLALSTFIKSYVRPARKNIDK